MKKTHYAIKEYNQSWKRLVGAEGRVRHIRVKFETLCGVVCDHTKATTDGAKVTCVYCQRKLG